MGRKRKQRFNPEKKVKASVGELKDSDGFYRYRTTYDVKCKLGRVTRVYLTQGESKVSGENTDSLFRTIGSSKNTYHHIYVKYYPDLCEQFAIVMATHAIDSRHSTSMLQNDHQAVLKFFEFLTAKDKTLRSFREIDFNVMVEYRGFIREQSYSRNSKYKGNSYNTVKKLLEITMGTRLGPERFEVPLYQVDSVDKAQTYSDAVIYQIIAAAYYECILIMEQYRSFSALVEKGIPVQRFRTYEQPVTWTLENFAWFFVNVMELKRPPYNTQFRCEKNLSTVASTVKDRFGLSFNKFVESKTDEEWHHLAKLGTDPRAKHIAITHASIADLAATWRKEASFVTHGYEEIGVGKMGQKWFLKLFERRNEDDLTEFFTPPFSSALNVSFSQREVASRDTLLPFFMLVSIFSGRNTEVLHRWKRVNNMGKSVLSLKDNADPLDPHSVLIRSYKWRGKRRVLQQDDVSISKDGKLYELLEFVIQYTQPAADLHQTKDMWTYLDYDGSGKVCNLHNTHRDALKKFCERHNILDDQGKRLTNIDMRLFRKVFLTKELLENINQHESYEDLVSDLKNKAGHKSFDTTISNYLNNDTTMQTIDAAIVVLQEKFIDESKAYCRLMDEVGADESRAGTSTVFSRCSSDEQEADEKHVRQHNCGDYDFCLGCSRSRVYEEHLPRICARVLQYEQKQNELDTNTWNSKYQKKYLRAQDVLGRWSKKEQVEAAWLHAKSGSITLPSIG